MQTKCASIAVAVLTLPFILLQVQADYFVSPTHFHVEVDLPGVTAVTFDCDESNYFLVYGFRERPSDYMDMYKKATAKTEEEEDEGDEYFSKKERKDRVGAAVVKRKFGSFYRAFKVPPGKLREISTERRKLRFCFRYGMQLCCREVECRSFFVTSEWCADSNSKLCQGISNNYQSKSLNIVAPHSLYIITLLNEICYFTRC